jgi:Fe-Mn family superoxide dismutase
MKRRDFIESSLKVSAAVSTAGLLNQQAFSAVDAVAFQFSQTPLPYSNNVLEPYIDTLTMDIHYNKHHAAYVKNANDAVVAEKIQVADEQEFFTKISSWSTKARNNGGGVWNHNFFWQIMTPASKEPAGKMLDALNGSFGSLQEFKSQFAKAAMGRFGSGWAWLVSDQGKLKIGSTPNQDNPLMPGVEITGKPVLALDVWEHAYYLKYQNKRADYIENWWNVVNWEKASSLL